mgnify:CR=1 FL=1
MLTMQLITLDNLAHRYSCLPSEALTRGTTLDLLVLHTSARYQEFQSGGQTTAEKKVKYNTKNHGLSNTDMEAMLERARNK